MVALSFNFNFPKAAKKPCGFFLAISHPTHQLRGPHSLIAGFILRHSMELHSIIMFSISTIALTPRIFFYFFWSKFRKSVPTAQIVL